MRCDRFPEEHVAYRGFDGAVFFERHFNVVDGGDLSPHGGKTGREAFGAGKQVVVQ